MGVVISLVAAGFVGAMYFAQFAPRSEVEALRLQITKIESTQTFLREHLKSIDRKLERILARLNRQ
jgi:hypothetical protein